MPPQVIPCFGVHPWFAHQHALTPGATLQDVVTAGPDSGDQWASQLEPPAPATSWMPRLRELLLSHPNALVGEFGLDRAAFIPGQPSKV